MSFLCPPGIHSKTPAPGLICNCARSEWELCLRQIIPQLLLWEFHILLRNIWPWCFLQMGYWLRGSLDHMKTCSQTRLFLKGPLNLLVQHSFLISYWRGSASLQKGNDLFRTSSTRAPGYLIVSDQFPGQNNLHSRRVVLRAAPSPTSVQGAALAPKEATLTFWLPQLQIEALLHI